ncbi:MAG: hypothetical protein M1839_002191 [Geoglossum umbratile]|nr:MAG: hypothetical protein M1839_002191 [Geoglossum umbratile]
MDSYAQDDFEIDCFEGILRGDDSIPIRDGHRPKLRDKVREPVFKVPHGSRIPVALISSPTSKSQSSKSQSSRSQSSCPVWSIASSGGSVPGEKASVPRGVLDTDEATRCIPAIDHPAWIDNATYPVFDVSYEPTRVSDTPPTPRQVVAPSAGWLNILNVGRPPPDTLLGSGPFFSTIGSSPEEFRPLTPKPRPDSYTPQMSASPGRLGLDGADATDQSADDEANSLHSSDGTDYEDSLLGESAYSGSCCGKGVDERGIIRPILDPVKHALVDRVMVEFYALFEANWTANSTNQAAAGSTSTPPSTQTTGSSTKSDPPTSKNGKHRMTDRDNDPPDENNHPKRKRVNSAPPDTASEGRKLACPFHKRDPQKYGINNATGVTYRTCSGPGWLTVGRIKEHLTRRHRAPTQCRRCWCTFNNELELQNHVRDAGGCEIRPEQPIEGITGEIEKKLRCKKKWSLNLDEEGKWRRIYEILFPGEPIPSPYYEPTEHSGPGSPASREISNYEAFSKRQLPQLVRRRLEAAAESEAPAIEEKLKTLLVEIVKDCQASVFLLYQEQRQADPSTSARSMGATNAAPTATTPSTPTSRANTVVQPGDPPSDVMNDMLIHLYQQNTLQGAGVPCPCPELDQNPPTREESRNSGQVGSSESGYGSLQSACKCSGTCHCGTASGSIPREVLEDGSPDAPNADKDFASSERDPLPTLDRDDFYSLFVGWEESGVAGGAS